VARKPSADPLAFSRLAERRLAVSSRVMPQGGRRAGAGRPVGSGTGNGRDQGNLVAAEDLAFDRRNARNFVSRSDGAKLFAHGRPQRIRREYFGDQLRTQQREAWKECNRRLYNYYRTLAPQLPNSFREMEPLFLAVICGCNAGLFREAPHEIYIPRIQRGDRLLRCQHS
jgi:hypothetical protein